MRTFISTALLLIWLTPAFGDTPATVTYCVDPNWMPYEGISDHQHIGMSSDYIQRISKLTGINFELVETRSWQESLQLLQNGQCQISPMLNKTPARDKYLQFSEIYFRAPNVLVTRYDLPLLANIASVGEQRLASVTNYRLTEYIAEHYPDIAIVEVASEVDGLKMVEQGDVEVFAGSLFTITQHIRKQGLANLRVSGWTGLDDELRIGVIPQQANLLPVLNNAIANLTTQDHINIYRQWNDINVVETTDYNLLWKILLPIGLLVILLLVRHNMISRYNQKLTITNDKLKRMGHELEQKNQKLAYLSNHDPLTNLYNRNYIAQVASEQIKLKRRELLHCCLVLVDIDDFKHINDHYGHNEGDHVLKSLSALMLDLLREVDLVSRWGGEEFIILCPGTSLQDCALIANRLRLAISDYDFSPVNKVTCSIGISELLGTDDFETWFERADQALYHAKSKGKNRVFCHDAIKVQEKRQA